MNGKLKALGLAFLAIAATSSLAAPAATAGALDVGVQPAVLTGQNEISGVKQTQTLTIPSTSGSQFNVKCTTASFEGTVQGLTVLEAFLTPKTSGCTAFGLSSTIHWNGCKFKFKWQGTPANTATVGVVNCTTGKHIQITTPLCNITLPQQVELPHTTLQNVKPYVVLKFTLSGILFQQDGAACPDGNGHQSSSGSLTGEITLGAYKDGGTKQVTMGGHQYTEHICSEQVSILST
jgi:Flp pilus assembly protein TadG